MEYIVHLTQSDFDTLISSGSVKGHTYDANNIYIIEENAYGTSTDYIPSTGISISLQDEGDYYFEVKNTYGISSTFGVVHIDSSSSSSYPILKASASTTNSTLTTNSMIRLRLAKASANTYTAYIDYCTNSTSMATYAVSNNVYKLKYWRINL